MSTAALAFTHTNGTLDLNGVTCTLGVYATGAGTKSLLFNGAYLYISGSGVTAFNNANPAGYTIGPGGSYGFILMSSATAKTFVGGGSNYDCYIVNSGTGALTISGNSTYTYLGLGYTILVTGSNSFKQIAAYYGSRVLTLTAGTTQTITVSGGWNVVGSAGDLTTINSGTAGTVALIARNYAVNDANYGGHTDYVSLKDINFTPSTTNGSGALPNIWWAGSHSTNLGNNFGITFTDWNGTAATSIKAYYISLTSTTSWTTPADWNPANNIVHLIGAGGGSAGSMENGTYSHAGGGGGGGGGYTVITNYSAAVGTPITLAIGTGGGGGAANANGASGGTTSFAGNTAGGGGGGTVTFSTTPASGGGAGGVGSTYNGGAGGAGSTTIALRNDAAGGGGGGAAGPNGPGGAGGTGFVAALGTSAGGGGGGNGGGSNGSSASSSLGGAGGSNSSGIGGGAASAGVGNAGSFGGGGSGAGALGVGGVGGNGIDILGTWGSGGGGGGSKGANGGVLGGNYGSGAGGASVNGGVGPILQVGAAGRSGLIVIQYYPLILDPGTPGVGSGFFAFF
jgi:hypothetical protein